MSMPSTYLRRPPRYANPAVAEPMATLGPTATYGITGLRLSPEGEIRELLFGLLDAAGTGWAIAPAPVRLIEVVDRLLDGDQARLVDETADGQLLPGPQVCVKMLDSGAETLEAVGGEEAVRALQALPRF